MLGQWKKYRVSEFVEINPKVQLKQGHEYSFVEMKDLDSSVRFAIPSAKRVFKGGSRFQECDTLFARITPCLENGKICQVKELNGGVGFGSTEFLIFRGIQNLSDNNFVYYLTRTEYFRNNAIQMMTGTSGRQRVETSALKELEIIAPDLNAQQEIASILTSLDNKIELNLQMNKTLEAMAQAIYKEWFVNFNFPGFDGELVDGLPRGWRRELIGNIVEVKGGTTPSTIEEAYWDGEFYWCTPKDISNLKSPVLLDTERKITDLGVKQISSGILPKGTLLLSSRAPIGYIAISQIPLSINQGFIAIQGKIVSNLFMLFWLKHNMKIVKGRANGSTFQEINKSNFKEIKIVLSTQRILKDFDAIIEPIFNKIVSNVQEINSLSLIRNKLLPKLMTGKIEINN